VPPPPSWEEHHPIQALLSVVRMWEVLRQSIWRRGTAVILDLSARPTMAENESRTRIACTNRTTFLLYSYDVIVKIIAIFVFQE
jgi:hypothetical protein